jgi:hypothetical protein
VRDRIEVLGRLPLAETLGVLASAHRLVALVSPRHPYSIPGKLFDYFAARRPILLVAPPAHAAADLLGGVAAHRCATPDDAAAVAALLASDAAALAAGDLPAIDPAAYASFTAEAQGTALSRWLREVAGRRG